MTPTETLVAELPNVQAQIDWLGSVAVSVAWKNENPDGAEFLSAIARNLHNARSTLTTQSALIETLTRERDEAIAEAADANSQWAWWVTTASEQKARAEAAEAALAVYDTIKAYGTPEELADMMAYVSGEATGEVAKLKASLAHCAMSLGREIALAADARQQYVDANEAKIDAEVALADLRDMTLEEAAARIEPKNERSDWTQYAHFMHEAAESIRALKSA